MDVPAPGNHGTGDRQCLTLHLPEGSSPAGRGTQGELEQGPGEKLVPWWPESGDDWLGPRVPHKRRGFPWLCPGAAFHEG